MANGYRPGGLCCIKGCDKPIWGQDFCQAHYARWLRHGHPLHGKKPQRRMKATRGVSRTKEYRTWFGVIYRCHNEKAPQYQRYGGRGITVCERWRNSFEAFLADMKNAPSAAHSIERIDNDKGYEPSNCRWATSAEQSRNVSTNVLTTRLVATIKRRLAAGEGAAGIAAELGVHYNTIYSVKAGKSWSDVEPEGHA